MIVPYNVLLDLGLGGEAGLSAQALLRRERGPIIQMASSPFPAAISTDNVARAGLWSLTGRKYSLKCYHRGIGWVPVANNNGGFCSLSLTKVFRCKQKLSNMFATANRGPAIRSFGGHI